MAGESIKDLVVRIGLETDPSSAKKSIEDLSKTIDTASKKIVASHKKEEAAVNKMTAAMATATKGAVKWASGIGNIDKANKAASKSVRDATDAALRQADAAKVSSDALATAGGTALRTARGVALLAGAYGLNTEATIRTVAAIQGGLDIFNNATLLIRSLAVATNFYTVSNVAATQATAGTAAVTTAASVAQKGMTASTISLAAAVRVLKAALGPVGLIVGGISLALAAGAAIWALWGSSGEKAIDKTAGKLASLKKDLVDIQTSRSRGASSAAAGDLGISSADGELKTARIRDQLAASTKRFAEAQKKLNKAQIENQNDKKRFESNARLIKGIKETDEREGTSDPANTRRFENENKLIASRTKNTAEIATAGNTQLLRQIQLRKQLKEQAEGAFRAQTNTLEKRKQSLEVAKKEVATAKAAVAAEQDKLRSIKARFGALSDLDRRDLKQLVAKAKAGTLNQEGENRLAQLGGEAASGVVQKRRVDRFDATGGAQVFRDLANLPGGKSVGAGLSKSQQELREAEARKGNETLGSINKKLKELQEARQKEREVELAIIDALGEQTRKNTNELNAIRTNLDAQRE